MPKRPPLKELQGGLDVSLEFDLTDFHEAFETRNAQSIQLSVYALIRTLRAKAALAFLLDGDRYSFFEYSHQAGLMFDLGNRLISGGMPHNDNVYQLSNCFRGFSEVLLTFPAPQIAETVTRMPQEMHDKDDPVDYWFLTFLMRSATNADAAATGALGELRRLPVENRDPAIETEICESLRERSAPRFLEAMKAYLVRREGEIAANERVNLGEDHISPEGLALRRLAASRGITVQIRHRLTPLELQENYPDTGVFSRGPVPPVRPETEHPEFWSGWNPVQEW